MSTKLHPELAADERRRLMDEGLELFNSGHFYDCHEAWETVWRSTTPEPKDLFRGLIQVAVGFFHFTGRRRPDVAHRVLGKARARVQPYAPTTLGLDINDLLRQLDIWRDWLRSTEPRASAPASPTLRISRRSLWR